MSGSVIEEAKTIIARACAAAKRRADLRLGGAQALAQVGHLPRQLELARGRHVGGGRRPRRAATAALGGAPARPRRRALAPPARAGGVDHLDRLGDPMLGAELVDRPPAALERPVVVDDEVAADASPGYRHSAPSASPRSCRRRDGRSPTRGRRRGRASARRSRARARRRRRARAARNSRAPPPGAPRGTRSRSGAHRARRRRRAAGIPGRSRPPRRCARRPACRASRA